MHNTRSRIVSVLMTSSNRLELSITKVGIAKLRTIARLSIVEIILKIAFIITTVIDLRFSRPIHLLIA